MFLDRHKRLSSIKWVFGKDYQDKALAEALALKTIQLGNLRCPWERVMVMPYGYIGLFLGEVLFSFYGWCHDLDKSIVMAPRCESSVFFLWMVLSIEHSYCYGYEYKSFLYIDGVMVWNRSEIARANNGGGSYKEIHSLDTRQWSIKTLSYHDSGDIQLLEMATSYINATECFKFYQDIFLAYLMGRYSSLTSGAYIWFKQSFPSTGLFAFLDHASFERRSSIQHTVDDFMAL
ncbi:hypothetical protein K492DRAFT_200093 [Lichtheimia hyalospora FSU 10163]|nr:hypothetical protein K492DRAFT_200093 [Lichtheimia hyalospora FSU 10163]